MLQGTLRPDMKINVHQLALRFTLSAICCRYHQEPVNASLTLHRTNAECSKTWVQESTPHCIGYKACFCIKQSIQEAFIEQPLLRFHGIAFHVRKVVHWN